MKAHVLLKVTSLLCGTRAANDLHQIVQTEQHNTLGGGHFFFNPISILCRLETNVTLLTFSLRLDFPYVTNSVFSWCLVNSLGSVLTTAQCIVVNDAAEQRRCKKPVGYSISNQEVMIKLFTKQQILIISSISNNSLALHLFFPEWKKNLTYVNNSPVHCVTGQFYCKHITAPDIVNGLLLQATSSNKLAGSQNVFLSELLMWICAYWICAAWGLSLFLSRYSLGLPPFHRCFVFKWLCLLPHSTEFHHIRHTVLSAQHHCLP